MNPDNLFLVGAAVIAVVSIPLILKVVPPNHLYGFRTPSTLSNRALWYRANVFAGWALLIAAVASIALNVGIDRGVLPAVASGVVVFVLPLLIAVIACFIYLQRISGNGAGGSNDG
jgi:uncharacterized membrane protein